MHGTCHEPAALDARRRKLLFRANHRGTRENDVLIGTFVASRIAWLTPQELDELETILDLPDPLMSAWLLGATPLPDDAPVLLRAMVDEVRRA